MSKEDWDNLDRKERSIIFLCLSDLVLLNIFGEGTTKKLWEKLGNLSYSKTLVNKLFLLNKIYRLRMADCDFVTKHLNYFNTLVHQVFYVNINMEEEDKCITLLCSLPNSWDNLVVSIGSTTQSTLNLDDLITSLLLEEIRRKSIKNHNTNSLLVTGHYKKWRNKST